MAIKGIPIYEIETIVRLTKPDGEKVETNAWLQLNRWQLETIAKSCIPFNKSFVGIRRFNRTRYFFKSGNGYVWQQINGSQLKKLMKEERKTKLILDLAQVK